MFDCIDTQMMQNALALARLGRFSTSPNPRVGCVIAHGSQIAGQGFMLKRANRMPKFTRCGRRAKWRAGRRLM